MFTPDDDVNLTAWMAEHFGYERKGRLGERAYRALVEVVCSLPPFFSTSFDLFL